MTRKPLLTLLGLGLLLTGRLPLLAQDSKEAVPVIIFVMDLSGAAVTHAQIKLAPQPATVPKNLETNTFGKTSIVVLPGKYDLFVDSPFYAHLTKSIEVAAKSNQIVFVILKDPIPEICSPCGTLEPASTPELPIGLLPLSSSRSLSLVQMLPPSVTHRSSSNRKKVHGDSMTPKNLTSSPNT
jgi:hypothetical protein